MRSHEHQKTLIYTMKNEQDHFLCEVRSTLTNFQPIYNQSLEKPEGSINHREFVVRVASHTSNSGLKMGFIMGSPVSERGQFGGGGTGGPGNWRYRKFDMPMFHGSDPDGWLMRVERYFNFYRLTEEKRLEAVVVALEGNALHWFQVSVEEQTPSDKALGGFQDVSITPISGIK